MVQVRGYSEEEVDALTDILSEMVVTSLKRVVTQTADQLQPAITASSSAGLTPNDVTVMTDLWLSEVEGQILPFVGEVYSGAAVSVAVGLADGFPHADMPGVPMVPDEFTQTFLKTVTSDFVEVGDDVWEDVREVLVHGVKDGESVEQIAAKMRYVTDFSQRRATEVARTVVHSASESGSIAQLRFVGYSDEDATKEWVSAHDARVRPTHSAADNQVVPLNTAFTVGGSSLDFPGDPSGPYSETRQCRCTMFFDVDVAPKYRCASSLVAAAPVAMGPADATYCVTPTPSSSALVSPEAKAAIIADWPKVTPAYGGAAIHKALMLVRMKMKAKGIDDSQIDDMMILGVLDDAMPSKGAFTFQTKFHVWVESPAGKKAGVILPKPTTHVVAPTTSPTAAAVVPKQLPPVAPKPDPASLTFTGKELGSHGAQVWVDDKGQRWLFKPQQKFMTDLDVGIAKIQSKAGDTRPGIYEITLDGKQGSIQFMFESDEAWPHGTFDPLKLSADDILILQQGQIFDWMISNFDTHSGQWIRLTGGRLFGTDKGQAFKFFGKDKLDWDYVPVTPLGSDKLTYSAMWKAFVQGKDIDLQDPMQGELGKYIAQLMAIPDDEYRALLQPYALWREKALGQSAKKFLDDAVARKNNLAKDFQEFWARAVAERAKHVKVPPVKPAPMPAAPPKPSATPLGFDPKMGPGDISGFAGTFKWDTYEIFLAANNGTKVTPAWGGAKIWKLVQDVKQAHAADGIDVTELQIVRMLDEVGGFKGKPKTYESVLTDWLNSAAGKKAVPNPPTWLAAPAKGAAAKATSIADDTKDALETIKNGEIKSPLDVFLVLEDFEPGDVMGYAQKGAITMRISRSKDFPDSVKVEAQNPDGSWSYVDELDDFTGMSQYSLTWAMKIAKPVDPFATGVKPVVSPLVPKGTSHIIGKAPGDDVTDIDVLSVVGSKPGSVIAYADMKPGAFMPPMRVVVDSSGKKQLEYLDAGVWKVDSSWDINTDGLPVIDVKTWKAADVTDVVGGPTLPPPPTMISKIPGKMPGDTVSPTDIESSKYLWKDGEEIASFTYPVGGKTLLISDGKGGVEVWGEGVGGTKWKVKTYPASKPLPKTIYGQKNWTLSSSTLSPVKVKPSPINAVNAGEVITTGDMHAYTGDIMQLAYAYDSTTGLEYRIMSNFGILKVQARTPGSGVWTDLYDELNEPKLFLDITKTKTWYAATKNGGEPDAYKIIVPGKTTTIVAPPPTVYPGQTLTPIQVIQHGKTATPGTVIAEAVDSTGFKMRIIVGKDGKLALQYEQLSKGKHIGWANSKFYQDIKKSSDLPPTSSIGWKAPSSTAVKATPTAPTAAPTATVAPPAKKVLSGTATHIPGKSVGDDILGQDIIANYQSYAEGQVIATLHYYGGDYRVFVANGKLIVQKQTKTGSWTGSKIVDTKWTLPKQGGWKAANDLVTPQHLKNAKKFVDKQYTSTPKAVISPATSKPSSKVLTPPPGFKARPIDMSMWDATERSVIVQAMKDVHPTTGWSGETLWQQLQHIKFNLQTKDPRFRALDEITILRMFDEANALAKGQPNAHVFEAKFVLWLKTPAGKNYVARRIDSPVATADIPAPMHALFDPANPDPDKQSYTKLTHDELLEDRRESHKRFGAWLTGQKAALKEYTGGIYTTWNDAIRKGALGIYRAKILLAQAGMRPSTRPMLLIRKVGWDEFNDPRIRSADSLRRFVGRRYTNRGFNSTSNTGGWSGSVTLEIECPIGTPMARVKDFSHYPSENETLLPTHLIYEIRDVKESHGTTIVRVRVVGVHDPSATGGKP